MEQVERGESREDIGERVVKWKREEGRGRGSRCKGGEEWSVLSARDGVHSWPVTTHVSCLALPHGQASFWGDAVFLGSVVRQSVAEVPGLEWSWSSESHRSSLGNLVVAPGADCRGLEVTGTHHRCRSLSPKGACILSNRFPRTSEGCLRCS